MPLYAVETVRALVADRRLELVEGAYRPVGELGDLAIPETLRSLIASRLDALDPADRSLVQDGAVLGQTFTLAGLAAVTGRDEADLEGRLRVLIRRELIELEVDPRSPERGQYGFVQSLIREVAYGMLARPERRARHLAVARFFETLGEDELAGALATHYVEAYRASSEGPEASAVAIQARLALSGAAARAATLGAHDQAVAYLVQGLDVTADPAERGPLLERAALSASDASDHEAAVAFARRAIEELQRSGDGAGAARATAELGAILLNALDPREATQVLESALASLPADVPDDVRARLLANLSRAYMRTDRFERSVEVADQALPIAERLDLTVVIADAFNNKASSLSYLGRVREASALMEAAIVIAHESGDISTELRARSNLASTLWSSEPRRVIEMQAANYELACRVGNRQMANWIIQSLVAGTWLNGGDWDAVLAKADEALATVRDVSEEASILSSICLIRAARGEPTDDALRILESAAEQLSDPLNPAQVHALKGDRALVRGDNRTAFGEFMSAAEFRGLASIYQTEAARPALWSRDPDLVRQVLAQLDATADADRAATLAVRVATRAGLAALEGRRQEALAGYRDAFERYAALGYEFALAQVELDAILLLGTDAPELRAAADHARAVFERVRARPYVDWLAAATTGPAEGSATASTPETSDREVAGRS